MVAQTRIIEPLARLVIHDLAHRNGHAEFAADVRRGLSSNPKHLFPKYLYDALGSRLFDAICHVDEYYPTRAEDEILTRHANEMVASIPEKSSRALLAAYPALRIEAYAADYLEGLAAMQPLAPGPSLILFLGSNIGNFEKAEALTFLRAIRRMLRPGDALLLGADLKKDRATLEAAYNDALGVTRAFIVNELARINRELGGNFDLWAFGLRSVYNDEAGCVEVFLESLRPQSVTIKGLEMSVSFGAGEWMHMEHSYKFDMEELSKMGLQSGFRLERTWLDERQRFSSNLFRASDA